MKSLKVKLGLCGMTIALAVLGISAQANTMKGSYYKVPIAHPDVENGIDGAIIPGLVEMMLGPNGLPVASAFGKTYAGGSGPITDIDAMTSEIQWWSAPNAHGITLEKIQVDAMPLGFFTDFFPDGESDNSRFMRAVHWEGHMCLTEPETRVGFKLSGDDDAWLFINGVLTLDAGGVHALSGVSDLITYGPGTYDVDLFFIDRHTVQSGITFSSTVEFCAPDVPEPGTVALFVGAGVSGLLLRRRVRKNKK